MLRFVLLTCWLIGAGGGWGLGLAGLNAMGAGAGSYAELIVLGGAASWAAMLVTALRPGKRPNLWQRAFTVLAWMMPVGMFLLGDTFNLNVRLFSLLAAACVTMIVIIYPSQSPQPRLDEGRRLALHVHKQEAEKKAEEKRKGDGAFPGDAQAEPVTSNDASGDQAAPTRAPGRSQSPDPTPTTGSPPARDGWAPQATSRPAAASSAEPVQESSSRWETPQVRRRGKLRDEPSGGVHRSSEDRGR